MSKATLPPYPRIAELYRALAVALDTKDDHSGVDELARRGEFDWSAVRALSGELIVLPLARHTDPEFAYDVGKWLADVHADYVRLVSTVSLDILSRAEALPILVEHYFAPIGMGAIWHLCRKFNGPSLVKLLDPDLHPVAAVLAWLDEGRDTPIVKVAFPASTDTDRNDVEKYRKWTRGTDLPDRQSIVRLASALEASGDVPGEKIRDVRRWLLVARLLAYMERASPVPFRAGMLRVALSGNPVVDIGAILSKAVSITGERFISLGEPAAELQERLKLTTLKDVGEMAESSVAIDAFQHLASDIDPEGRLRFLAEWMRARWNMLSGKFELALAHYETAADLSNYRAGAYQKHILQETLVLAGHLRKKALLKRLKHRAIAFELFVRPNDDVVEDWEIEHLCQQFPRVFPAHGRFAEAITDDVAPERLPFLAIDQDEIERIQLDRRNPDRIITVHFADGRRKRQSQLQYFASFGDHDAVRTLLEANATANSLDESGGSALLCAIQHATRTRDRRVLDLLLHRPHAREILDSVTAKKQLTPLLCAIDLGEADVVLALLEMGASADLRGNIVNQTPLWLAVEKLAVVSNPRILHDYLTQSFASDADSTQREVFRRYQVSRAGTFGDESTLASLRSSPQYRPVLEDLVSAMVQDQVERHSVPKLLEIIESLLKYNADPNAVHTCPSPGRTPLMLAAEDDSDLALELLLRYGGNPHQTDEDGMSAFAIAIAFGAPNAMDRMRKNGFLS